MILLTILAVVIYFAFFFIMQILLAAMVINFFKKFNKNRVISIVSGTLFLVSETVLIILTKHVITLMTGEI